jgi:uncharacterized protein (DUF1501 family)
MTSPIGRRQFLKGSAAAAAAAWCAPRTWATAPRADAAGRVLVMLELAGGNDGLNTLVPYAHDAYAEARGDLALAGQELLRLDDEVGLHPALTGLKTLHDAGHVAWVEGVGYPDPIRSHFLSMDIWHAGQLDGRRGGSGWLARLVDHLAPDDDDPNLLVALGPRVPFSCDGGEHRAVAFAKPADYRLVAPGDETKTLDSAVSSTQVSERARAFLRRAYLDARASSDVVRSAVGKYQPAVKYPGTALAGDLRTVAALIAGGVSTRVFSLQLSGFDTHNGQRGRQQRLFAELGDALAAFHDDLRAARLDDRVLVVGYSEFGRRVAANASGGTDHGAAGLAFLLGSHVKGGLFGKRPALDRLDDNGDLAFTTDFRRVYATAIDTWLQADAAKVLGERFEPLRCIA